MTNQPKQKTAIRQLIEKIDKGIAAINVIPDRLLNADIIATKDALHSVKLDAESLESVNEQQIIDAYDAGYGMGANRKSISSEKYFNKTFEKP